MSSVILQETILPLAQAARRFPKAVGRSVNPSTIWRWCHRGIQAPGGGRIYLEAARLGGGWFTSAEALARFAEAVTPQRPANTIPPRSAGQRAKAIQRANAELAAAGI